jgi:hypothetical protein
MEKAGRIIIGMEDGKLFVGVRTRDAEARLFHGDLPMDRDWKLSFPNDLRIDVRDSEGNPAGFETEVVSTGNVPEQRPYNVTTSFEWRS